MFSSAGPLVHMMQPKSNSGSHSTLEGFVPSLTHFILIGDGDIDPDSSAGYTEHEAEAQTAKKRQRLAVADGSFSSSSST